MKRMMTAAAATALIGLLATAAPSRADEECDTVVKAVSEALAIVAKNFETTMGELKETMSKPAANDKARAAIKNKFCSSGGEMLGTSRALRAVVGECSADQRAVLATLDKSVSEIETAVDGACK
jgi:hypothetical protein